MRLVSVTLRNFRCYRDATTITLDDLTTVIGQNDVGKSSVLEALEIFFNNAAVKIERQDCNVASDSTAIEITCEFSDLPPSLILDAQAETSLSAEYLLNPAGNLCIMKRFQCAGAKPKEEVFVLAHHPTADQYGDLLELNNNGLKKRLRELGIDENKVQLNSNPSIRSAIWASCPALLLGEVAIPVAKEDGKRIWDKLSEHLPIYALFRSDRPSQDSDSEVQDPMKFAIATALAEPAIQQKLTEVVDAVREKAVDLAQRTHRTLSRIDPNLARELTPEFRSDPRWSGVFSLALNSDQGIPMNKRGSGVRRLILVSFFRAEAERRLTEAGARNIIYAIEEPETSQHPHSQRILLESLQDLASEPGCQVILTTHSPGFASYLPISSFRFIRRGNGGCPQVEPATDSTWEAIAAALGVVPDNRVRVLVCVEGPTDVDALGYLSKALHTSDRTLPDLSVDPCVAFVVLGGGNLHNWVHEHYLRNLGRPEVHIYDGDVDAYRKHVADVNNRADGSWAARTSKREIENYLHPDAITEGLSVTVVFGDTDDVPDLVAKCQGWKTATAKKKLSQYAFPCMTAARLAERDPAGEVEGWLRRIGAML